jgi:glycosyltransferase involved in cell wall biosynthesis
MDISKKHKSKPSFVERITQSPSIFHDYEFPKVSIIVPTNNSALTLSLTIESVISQHYPDYEIVVIDSGSTDRTIEILKGYRNDRINIYSVSTCEKYEMLNKGVTQSTGEYLNFLFPGDYYLSRNVLLNMMTLALENERPHLVYSGTLLRYGRKEPEIFFRKFSHELLRKGQMPTSLQSCWFLKEVFHEVGKFDTSLTLRGAYDLMCRMIQHEDMRVISSTKVLTDYDLRVLSRTLVVSHFRETSRIVFRYYGLWAYLMWLKNQRSLARYLRLWWHGLKVAVLGVKP